ncbi:hypothetical protein LP419_14655 [Massilia sp. H-1]|nr:hypothetical protein LP419_14655 [Massilia sp. H-1]
MRLGIGDGVLAPVAAPIALLHQVRVMVVDDSATAAAALVEMLGSFGIAAESTESGETRSRCWPTRWPRASLITWC